MFSGCLRVISRDRRCGGLLLPILWLRVRIRRQPLCRQSEYMGSTCSGNAGESRARACNLVFISATARQLVSQPSPQLRPSLQSPMIAFLIALPALGSLPPSTVSDGDRLIAAENNSINVHDPCCHYVELCGNNCMTACGLFIIIFFPSHSLLHCLCFVLFAFACWAYPLGLCAQLLSFLFFFFLFFFFGILFC